MVKNGPRSLNTFNRNIVDEFRANAGKVGGQFVDANLLLLTSTGAKSGHRRLSPLAFAKSQAKASRVIPLFELHRL